MISREHLEGLVEKYRGPWKRINDEGKTMLKWEWRKCLVDDEAKENYIVSTIKLAEALLDKGLLDSIDDDALLSMFLYKVISAEDPGVLINQDLYNRSDIEYYKSLFWKADLNEGSSGIEGFDFEYEPNDH